MAIPFAIAATASACAWVPRARPVREREALQLQSVVLTAPAGPGWTVQRKFEATRSSFVLTHVAPGGEALEWDRRVRVLENEYSADVEPAGLDLPRAVIELLDDPRAVIEPITFEVPPRFGPDAVVAAARVVESERKAEGRERRVAHVAALWFRSPGERRRGCELQLWLRGSEAAAPAAFAEVWRALLDDVEVRPATAGNIAASASGSAAFPKTFEAGLARRSLSLPQLGFQWRSGRERWISPQRPWGSASAAIGLSDRLQLETPGFVSYSFGDVEALRGPELSIGGGLTGYAHDARRGSAWGFGAEMKARKRVSMDVALRGEVLAEGVHESRTRRDGVGGSAAVGVAWDVHPLVTLGLDTGAWARPWSGERGRGVWVGGRTTPLVTLHVPFCDLALTGAAAWVDGRPGVLVGFNFTLTL